jgi:hypothetical protein
MLDNKHNTSKHKQNMVIASADMMSGGNKVLNNELNVKIDFNALGEELKSLGINFNKSLHTL